MSVLMVVILSLTLHAVNSVIAFKRNGIWGWIKPIRRINLVMLLEVTIHVLKQLNEETRQPLP